MASELESDAPLFDVPRRTRSSAAAAADASALNLLEEMRRMEQRLMLSAQQTERRVIASIEGRCSNLERSFTGVFDDATTPGSWWPSSPPFANEDVDEPFADEPVDATTPGSWWPSSPPFANEDVDEPVDDTDAADTFHEQLAEHKAENSVVWSELGQRLESLLTAWLEVHGAEGAATAGSAADSGPSPTTSIYTAATNGFSHLDGEQIHDIFHPDDAPIYDDGGFHMPTGQYKAEIEDAHFSMPRFDEEFIGDDDDISHSVFELQLVGNDQSVADAYSDKAYVAAASATTLVVHNNTYESVPSSCSTQCPSHVVDAMVAVVTHTLLPTLGSGLDTRVLMPRNTSQIITKEFVQATHNKCPTRDSSKNMHVLACVCSPSANSTGSFSDPFSDTGTALNLLGRAMTRPMPWPSFTMSAVFGGGYMSFTLLFKRFSSQRLTNCLKLLGLSMFGHGRLLWDPGIAVCHGGIVSCRISWLSANFTLVQPFCWPISSMSSSCVCDIGLLWFCKLHIHYLPWQSFAPARALVEFLDSSQVIFACADALGTTLHLQSNSMYFNCVLVACFYRQPWPPPISLEIFWDCPMICTSTWPSFVLSDLWWCWKPPWFGYAEFLATDGLISGTDCIYIQSSGRYVTVIFYSVTVLLGHQMLLSNNLIELILWLSYSPCFILKRAMAVLYFVEQYYVEQVHITAVVRSSGAVIHVYSGSGSSIFTDMAGTILNVHVANHLVISVEVLPYFDEICIWQNYALEFQSIESHFIMPGILMHHCARRLSFLRAYYHLVILHNCKQMILALWWLLCFSSTNMVIVRLLSTNDSQLVLLLWLPCQHIMGAESMMYKQMFWIRLEWLLRLLGDKLDVKEGGMLGAVLGSPQMMPAQYNLNNNIWCINGSAQPPGGGIQLITIIRELLTDPGPSLYAHGNANKRMRRGLEHDAAESQDAWSQWPVAPSPPSAHTAWPDVPTSSFPPSKPPRPPSSPGSLAQREALRAAEEFFTSQGSDDDDDDEEELEEANKEDAVRFFTGLFERDAALRRHYEQGWEEGLFACMACVGSKAHKGKARRFRGCVGLVQHARAAIHCRRVAAHRAFAAVVCRVLGWDIERLPSIVIDPRGTLGQALAARALSHAGEPKEEVETPVEGSNSNGDQVVDEQVTSNESAGMVCEDSNDGCRKFWSTELLKTMGLIMKLTRRLTSGSNQSIEQTSVRSATKPKGKKKVVDRVKPVVD